MTQALIYCQAQRALGRVASIPFEHALNQLTARTLQVHINTSA